MSQESKFFIGIGLITIIILAGAVFFMGKPQAPADSKVVLGAQQQGPENSVVTLVEFSDYQCPFCAQAWPYIEKLVGKYPNNLQFVYRHFPLPQHQFAKEAAYAAESAGKQGKFWGMSKLLFENQDKLSPDLFPKLAQDLGLNIEQFKKDVQDDAIKNKVEADLSDAKKLGLNSTPTFFLNNNKINLQNFSDLEQQVEKSIEKLPQRN